MKNRNIVFQTLALISQVGISMIVPILLCVILGVFLEERFSLSLTIPLIVVGVLAGARNVYVLLKHAGRAITSKEDGKE